MTDQDTDNSSNLTVRQYVRICWRMIGISWNIRPFGFVTFFAGAIVEISSTLVTIYATAQLGALLARFVANGQTAHIWLWLWVDIAASAGIALGFFIMEYAKRLQYFAFVRWSTHTYLSTMSRIDIGDFYDDTTRNHINKVSDSYTWQLSNLSNTLMELLYALIRFVAITAVVAQIVWWIIPTIAIFLIPTLLAESRLAKLQWFVWNLKGDERHVFWGLNWLVRQPKTQMELRSTQASGYVLDKINSLNTSFYKEQEAKYRSTSRIIVPTKLLEVVGTAIGSIVLLRQLLGHAISLNRYFFLSGALLRVGGALNTIFGTVSRMQDSLIFADNFFTLTDAKPKIVDTASSTPLTAVGAPDILFQKVSFKYPGQDHVVMKNFSLHIRPGEHVALVGENGAGKSTLIKLLLRFYKPTAGRILINGVDLQNITIESWYDQLATLFQDFNQYPFPISENIEIGRTNRKADKDMRDTAAKFAGVTELINGYEHGWETVLDSSFKKGIEPSGGQWQRVAIARAFYRNADLIILDEPTSAIDAKVEYDIFNNIFEHYEDKSALIVSHRFSTVRRADRIVVLDNGKIIEEGSHAELMKQKGIYHELFSKQAEGYRD